MPKTPDYFHDKTIVITGAASGIGRATALIFAREGANVVCADLNGKGAGETAAEVNRKGSKALAVSSVAQPLKTMKTRACVIDFLSCISYTGTSYPDWVSS